MVRAADGFGWPSSPHTAGKEAKSYQGRLKLSEISQQRWSLIRRHEPAIDDESVRRKKRWQVRGRIEPGHSSEESVVVVQYLLECRGGVIVKVRCRSADSTKLGGVHDSKVSGLPREEQSPGVRGCNELERAVRECDAIRARIALKPLRTRRVAICGRVRTCSLDLVIAHEGTYEPHLGSGTTRMQRAAVTLGTSAVEDYFAVLFQYIQLRVGIGKGS